MRIQIEEAQVVWWVIGGCASTVAIMVSIMWAMLNKLREDVARQIGEANEHIENHMRVEEERWSEIYREFSEIRRMFVTREVLELRLGALESNIQLIRKVLDTRTAQRRTGADENSERPS